MFKEEKKTTNVELINPQSKLKLKRVGDKLIDADGNEFSIIKNVPRICNSFNYAQSFGFQWKNFDKIQLDGENSTNEVSRERFFKETNWHPQSLDNKNVLEVGAGAGRFSRVVLKHTNANLWSCDYSDAVEVNYKSNFSIAPQRFQIAQASIYDLPYPDKSFDYVFCFGVLQHTPNFDLAFEALAAKLKEGGEIAVDFYPINGWWTKLHAKYILRPFSKKINNQKLLKIISNNVDALIWLSKKLTSLKLGVLTRFIPLVDLETIPKSITPEEFREWVILDTFDMFSPEHDHPQRLNHVKRLFQLNGITITFAGKVRYGNNFIATVVRGIKLK
jgi:ubiquinone/menaquinone biosynthesis C-methylase UbiE